MRVVFLGTPDFSVPILSRLCSEGFDVVGVVTQPDKPQGRGCRIAPCAVKCCAQVQGLQVYSFDRIRNSGAVQILRDMQPDVMVTAAYGQILSQRVLDVPSLGCVNVHASLLPKYRGPAPIQWAIINGEQKTGVTTMLTDIGVDTGDILLQRELDIAPDETAGEMFDRLSLLGADVLVETLRQMERGNLIRTPQNHEEATHHPMLKKEDGRIDWTKSAEAIHNLVRGVNPWPGAYCWYGENIIKVLKARPCGEKSDLEPGGVVCCSDKKGLFVSCGANVLQILELQIAGKKRMDACSALRGFAIREGSSFS